MLRMFGCRVLSHPVQTRRELMNQGVPVTVRGMRVGENLAFPMSAIHVNKEHNVWIDPDAVITGYVGHDQGEGSIVITRVGEYDYTVNSRNIDNLHEKISDAAAPSNFIRARFDPKL
jgi:hypothetical protein